MTPWHFGSSVLNFSMRFDMFVLITLWSQRATASGYLNQTTKERIIKRNCWTAEGLVKISPDTVALIKIHYPQMWRGDGAGMCVCVCVTGRERMNVWVGGGFLSFLAWENWQTLQNLEPLCIIIMPDLLNQTLLFSVRRVHPHDSHLYTGFLFAVFC